MYIITIAKIDRWGRENRIDKLVEALHHESDEIRKAAALCLGKVGNSKILDSLETALESDPDYFVRKDIEKAIASIRSRIHQEIHEYRPEAPKVVPAYNFSARVGS